MNKKVFLKRLVIWGVICFLVVGLSTIKINYIYAGDDDDGDKILDMIDNCPNNKNLDQADRDEDAFGDVCDKCPDSYDSNNDGQSCASVKPLPSTNPNAASTDIDTDGDGIMDKDDNCPNIPNKDQKDSNSNNKGDVCDEGADAQNYNPPVIKLENPVPYLNQLMDVFILMRNIINFLLGVIGSLSLGYFVFNGVKLLTSAGNSEKITQVRESLFWAVLGIVFALSSYVILREVLYIILGVKPI